MIHRMQIGGGTPVVLDTFHLANNDVIVFRGTLAPHEIVRFQTEIARQFGGRDVLLIDLGNSDVSVEHLDEEAMARHGWIRAEKAD